MDDITLVQTARNGDLEAFNLLALRYQDFLFGIAARMLGDDDDAADAVQDGLIAAFHKLDGYRGGSLRGWLARIVVNLCYDELRRRKRHIQTPLELEDEDGQEMESLPWLADQSPGPEALYDERDLESLIQNCLQRVVPHYRAALVLVDVEGLSYEEAAQTLHVPVGTVKSRLARARLQVRQALSVYRDRLPSPYALAWPAPVVA